MHHGSREIQLGMALVEAADTLSEAFDTGTYLQRLSDHCVALLNASAAGIMLVEGGERVSFGVSSRRQELALDLLEIQHHGGPCLDSYGTGEPVPPVTISAAHAASRWPDFTARALRYDVAATFAVPLRRDGTALGALNVFVPAAPQPPQAPQAPQAPQSSPLQLQESLSPHPLAQTEYPAPEDESGLHLAQTLADAAAVGLTNHRTYSQYRTLAGQLQQALSSRVRIEQAKGMLAERWGTGVDEAFMELRHYARSRQLPLDDVATAVITRAEDVADLGRGRDGPS
ncbi:GAF and ANTAR domain-containing protein [Streptomyces sp. 2A115]|uniref:GAF and ANTAR domain-containing protein n=1 Tax=Streptomyces sp. 2A115 TaxID=3457439 RepID=UPI003FD37BBC